MFPKRLGAIDLGTNSARLAVYEVARDGTWSCVADERVPCRLGQDLARTGRLHPDAERRSMQALCSLVEHARRAGAERLCMVGTWALRRAANGAEFARRVRRETGLELRILSGEEEASLVLRAARLHVSGVANGRVVCLDLGGGSLELARDAESGARFVSLPLGAVVTSEALVIPTPLDAIEALRRDTAATLRREAPEFARVADDVVAAGGTVTSAARLLGTAPPLAGARLQRDGLEALLVRIAPLDRAARKALPGLPADRADLIVAGLAVLCETMLFLGAGTLRVHEQGVREGVLLAMLAGEMCGEGTA